MYCIWRCFNRIRWLVTHWHMTIHDHTTVCSYHTARLNQSDSLTRGTVWLRYPGTQPNFLFYHEEHGRNNLLYISCLFADEIFSIIGCSTLWWLINFGHGLFIKYPFWNNLGWSCSSWSPSRQGNLRRSMSLTSNTSVKAAGWVDFCIPRIVSQAPERSSRKIRVSELNIVAIFFGVEKQYLASFGIWTYTGWWFGTFFIFHFIYGMSSFPLTNSYFSEG